MNASLIKSATGFARGRAGVLAAVWRHPLNRGSKLRAFRDYLLWNAVRFSMDARHVVRMPQGLEIILGQKERYGTGVYVHFLADFNEMMFLAHLLHAADLFADIGANVGMYSVWVAGVTGARAIAMEPVPSTFATLRRNVRLNDLEPLIEPLKTAVGETSAEALMSSEEGGENYVLERKAAEDSIVTPVVRLDDILAGRYPCAIKIDVEGFELHVLRGAVATLRDTRLKAIIMEVQDVTLTRYGTNEEEVCSLVEDHGFRVHSYDPFSRMLSPAKDHSGLNRLFVRPSDDDVRERLSTSRKVPLPGYPAGL